MVYICIYTIECHTPARFNERAVEADILNTYGTTVSLGARNAGMLQVLSKHRY